MSIWEDHPLARRFWNEGRADIPIYDMHGHMGCLNTIYFARAEADQMVAHMRRIGIRRLVFSHHHALFEPSFRNVRAWEICRKHPDILRIVRRRAEVPAGLSRHAAHRPQIRVRPQVRGGAETAGTLPHLGRLRL